MKHSEIFKICLILIVICLPISYGAYFGYMNHTNTKATAVEVKSKVIDKSSTNGTSNVYVHYNNKQYIFQVGGTQYADIKVGDSIYFLYSASQDKFVGKNISEKKFYYGFISFAVLAFSLIRLFVLAIQIVIQKFK